MKFGIDWEIKVFELETVLNSINLNLKKEQLVLLDKILRKLFQEKQWVAIIVILSAVVDVKEIKDILEKMKVIATEKLILVSTLE